MNAKTDALRTNENNKFANNANGDVGVNVINTGGMGISPYDNVAITYPTATQEVYEFTLSSVNVGTVTVDYIDSSKTQISNVART